MYFIWCVLGFLLVILPLPQHITGGDQDYVSYVDFRNRKILYTPIVINGGNQSTDDTYYNTFLDLVLLCKNKRHVDVSVKDFAEQIIGNFPSLSEKIGDISYVKHRYIYYKSYYHITVQHPLMDKYIYNKFVQVAEHIAFDCGFKILFETPHSLQN